jgi:hypothetical protein
MSTFGSGDSCSIKIRVLGCSDWNVFLLWPASAAARPSDGSACPDLRDEEVCAANRHRFVDDLGVRAQEVDARLACADPQQNFVECNLRVRAAERLNDVLCVARRNKVDSRKGRAEALVDRQCRMVTDPAQSTSVALMLWLFRMLALF